MLVAEAATTRSGLLVPTPLCTVKTAAEAAGTVRRSAAAVQRALLRWRSCEVVLQRRRSAIESVRSIGNRDGRTCLHEPMAELRNLLVLRGQRGLQLLGLRLVRRRRPREPERFDLPRHSVLDSRRGSGGAHRQSHQPSADSCRP